MLPCVTSHKCVTIVIVHISHIACKNSWPTHMHYEHINCTNSGNMTVDWEEQGIVPYLFSCSSSSSLTTWKCYLLACRDCPPMSGKPGQSMVLHLSKCVLVGLDVQNHALEEINSKKI
jgi:hypothetical protein